MDVVANREYVSREHDTGGHGPATPSTDQPQPSRVARWALGQGFVLLLVAFAALMDGNYAASAVLASVGAVVLAGGLSMKRRPALSSLLRSSPPMDGVDWGAAATIAVLALVMLVLGEDKWWMLAVAGVGGTIVRGLRSRTGRDG